MPKLLGLIVSRSSFHAGRVNVIAWIYRRVLIRSHYVLWIIIIYVLLCIIIVLMEEGIQLRPEGIAAEVVE